MSANTKTHQFNISIGIPAYNEAANLGRLIREVLAQTGAGINITEVVIASDGSTDRTAAVVAAVGDPRVRLAGSGERRGKTARLTELISHTTGDILVLMDADVQLDGPSFLERALHGFDPARHGLIGFNTTPLPGRTFVERSLNAGMAVVEQVRGQWLGGANYLSYRGSCLLLSRQLANVCAMPDTLVTNDAYFLFAALKHGFAPGYRANCRVYYRSPSTLADHIRQSHRFAYSIAELETCFNDHTLHAAYVIPRGLMLHALLAVGLRRPLYLAGYIAINLYTSRLQPQQSSTSATWEVAMSTKEAIDEV
jgi:glycosyltransferase involved in cell wall biosynthesis